MSDQKKMTREELEQAQGGTSLPLAGGEPKSTKQRDLTRDFLEDPNPPGLSGDHKDAGPDPLRPHR